MIRPAALPRPVRVGAATVGVLGVVALAGCASGAADAEPAATVAATSAATGSSTPSSTATADSSDAAATTTTSTYKDGTYEASGSYRTPETTETIDVTITLADDVITAVEVTGDPQATQSKQFQSQFIGGIADVVVGKDIDDISVSRVAGSSLTSGGFNAAIETIKSEAAA